MLPYLPAAAGICDERKEKTKEYPKPPSEKRGAEGEDRPKKSKVRMYVHTIIEYRKRQGTLERNKKHILVCPTFLSSDRFVTKIDRWRNRKCLSFSPPPLHLLSTDPSLAEMESGTSGSPCRRRRKIKKKTKNSNTRK